MVAPYLADNYSWLSRWIGDGITPPRHPSGFELSPSWVPASDQRRLAAYTILAAFADNCSHFWQPFSDEQKSQWREYGDVELFTTQARSAVMGETQTIAVDIPMSESDNPQPDPAAEAARDWLIKWADQEQLTGRLLDAEHDALGLGDAVYVLGWNATQNRPRMRVFDPGFYFPDPDSQSDDDDFPKTVNLAWEEPHPVDKSKTVLRRQQWKLQTLEATYPTRPDLWETTYPWTAKDEKSKWTVLYSDGQWDLNAVATGNGGLYNLGNDRATWLTPTTDLHMDFIPVVHVPNGAPGKQLWGRPVWWQVVRLFADIAASDTDAQVGSELYGSGALLDKGGGIGGSPSGPGAVFGVAESADAKFVDMSAGMKAMDEFRASQRDLASVNTRLPAEVLGRVKASEVPSGVPFRLAMGPFSNLIRELRLVRFDKHSLMLKMVMRLGQQNNQLAAGPLPRAELVFGSFLPSDLAEAISNVTKLYGGDVQTISTATAIQMLIDAGLPIEDALEEIKRIRREDYKKLGLFLDATGSEKGVQELANTGELPVLEPFSSVLPVPTITGGA